MFCFYCLKPSLESVESPLWAARVSELSAASRVEL